MTQSFLSRRSLFGAPNALLILLVVFFLVPFVFRGARHSLETNENAVKDWLPAEFRETKELEWFSRYFYGESFVLATWRGATEDSQKLSTLAAKLRKESLRGRLRDAAENRERYGDWDRAQELAEELGLMLPSDLRRNWGGEQEIWLASARGGWYYLTPDGSLYRWEGRDDALAGLARTVSRWIRGRHVHGKFITALGRGGPRDGRDDDPGAVNAYYNNPVMLTAPIFATVQTGPEVAAELSREGGPAYPLNLTDPTLKPKIARRNALQQLSGTLYAPAVPEDFSWTPEAFLERFPEPRRAELPDDFTATVASTVARLVDEQFGGSLEALGESPQKTRTRVWYEVFDTLGIEPPPRQTAVLVTLTPFAQENLAHVVGRGVLGDPQGRLYQLAEQAGLSPPPPPVMSPPPFNWFLAEAAAPGPTLRVGGPPIDNISIDEEGSITLVRLVGYCAALGLLLSYVCFRSLKITMMIFFVGVIAAATSLSLVWWSGTNVDAILMSMPSLVYVLGLSAAIHIVNYYREEVEAGGVEGAPERALAHGWGPCTLASITTAIGLLSLYTSNIIPIQKFGLFSAIGVIATLALLFAYLPAALEIFVPSFAARHPKRRARRQTGKVGVGVLADRWESFGRWVVDHHRLVAVGCLVLFITAAFGLPKIKTSVQLLKLFGSEARIIRDYAWLEENFSKLVPMELVLRVPPEMQADSAIFQQDPQLKRSYHPLTPLERLEAVDRIERTLERAFGETGLRVAGNTMSASTMTPDPPPPSNGISAERLAFSQKLGDQLDKLIENDLLEIERGGPLDGSELWRISLRVGALSDVNYGHFVGQLRQAVEPILAAYRYRNQILDAQAASSSNDNRLLVLAREVPQRLGMRELIREGTLQTDAQGVATDAMAPELDRNIIFRSTLAELLANERFREVTWIDPGNEQFLDFIADDEKFRRYTDRFSGAVVLDESDAFGRDDLPDNLDYLIDGRAIDFDVSATEIVDGVPVVRDSGPLQVIYTGVIPVVYKAQNTLMNSLVDSIAWAFVLIAGVMIILLNPGRPVLGMLRPSAILWGIGAGAVAMLPNVFPVVVIFGSMGHLGTLVDIGTMMTASVAMGVAVDDTIHFLSWLRRGLDSGLDRREALIQTYRRVGPAMTQTTLVGGLGLFVFALSTFTPTQRFGTLMLVLLGAALVGDLVFLPALLASPLGKLFRARPHALADTGPAESQVVDATLPAPEDTVATADAPPSQRRRSSHPDALPSDAPAPKMLRHDQPHADRGQRNE